MVYKDSTPMIAWTKRVSALLIFIILLFLMEDTEARGSSWVDLSLASTAGSGEKGSKLAPASVPH